MNAAVQATCPGCQRVLRIPADWLGRTMRCKFCGNVMLAQRKVPSRSSFHRNFLGGMREDAVASQLPHRRNQHNCYLRCAIIATSGFGADSRPAM